MAEESVRVGEPEELEVDPSGEPPAYFFLEFLAGAERGIRVPLHDPEILVGRGTGGATKAPWIIVNDRTVSRHHVTLTWNGRDRHYWLQNLSQTNLTQVNGQTVTRSRLRSGDTLRLGNVVFTIHTGNTRPPVVPDKPKPLPARLRLNRLERAQIFTQVAAMTSVGIALARALDALADRGSSEPVRHACTRLAENLRNGASLSQAMRSMGSTFSTLHICSVQAGEDAGRLPLVLRELGAWEERDLSLTRALTASLTYPLAIFVCGLCLVFFLGNRVFATLIPVLTGSGKPLPLVTTVLVAFTRVAQDPRFLVLGIVVGGFAGRALWNRIRTPEGRRTCDELMLRVPVFGAMVRKLFVTRFCNHMNLLSESGIPLSHALETSAQLSQNEIIREAMGRAGQSLAEGLTLAESLQATGQFPRLVLGMVKVGEDTNQLELMLKKLSTLYDGEVYDALDRMSKLLEPLVIVVMGAAVAVIIVATMLPLYQLISL